MSIENQWIPKKTMKDKASTARNTTSFVILFIVNSPSWLVIC